MPADSQATVRAAYEAALPPALELALTTLHGAARAL